MTFRRPDTFAKRMSSSFARRIYLATRVTHSGTRHSGLYYMRMRQWEKSDEIDAGFPATGESAAPSYDASFLFPH